MKQILQFILIFILAISACSANPANPDLETIRQRFINELMQPKVDDARILQLMNSLHPDGTWPGINYQDVSNTGFQHGRHLENMVYLCRAFKKADSKYKGNKQLKKVIYSSLDYWLAHDFICQNWWWNQIGTPTAMSAILLIMDKDLSPQQVEKILPIVGRANLNASGARPSGDRIKIAGILAKTLLFKRDEEEFGEVVKVIEGEIKFSTERGMQYDYSFHHRVDWVNNTLSYGTGYADAFADWAANVAGTRYQFSKASLELLTNYYLDGICKMMIYGKIPDPGAMNRDITRADEERVFGTHTPECLMKASDYRKSELEEIVKIRRGEAKASLSHCTPYWHSDHLSVQRPNYFASVRMYSSRICNMEEPYNGEGLMNHHRGDGTNYISRTGDEYFDIAPVYDWQKIPGTTVMQKPALPSEKEIQKKGLTDFVGAVSDGLCGAAAFDFKSPHDPLQAKKAWFFFRDEYVCLGTGINSGSKLPVVTTLNQCRLRGEVEIMSDNQQAVVQKGMHQFDRVNWVFHDSIAYLFPKPQRVNLSNQAETGSWYHINHQSDSPKEDVSKDVFKLWIDHGAQVQDSGYEYLVVPAVGKSDLDKLAVGHPVEILSNTSDIQAVKNPKLNITQLVFYTSGEIQIANGLTIGTDSPGLVMVKTDGRNVRAISVADPTQKLRKIHLTVTEKIEKSGGNFKSIWNDERGVSEIAIDLPQTVYAGKSVSIDL